jgi:glycosyltransferase involved in cell wall biosynthesis
VPGPPDCGGHRVRFLHQRVRIGGRREINTDKNAAKLLLQRGAYALAHRIVANSRAAADRLRREGVPASRIRVVHNGIERPSIEPARTVRPVRRAITVANLRAEKGHDVLLEAIRLLDTGALTFDIVGDGPCRAALEAQARALGLADRVHFLGHREDVPALLAGSDLFVLPSRTEAFPNSVMEAMAAGLPVVATRTGGIAELVDDGVTGRLVDVGDARGLARSIGEIAASPAAAARMGDAGLSVVEARYSVPAMVRGFADIIQEELRTGRRTVAGGRRIGAPRPLPHDGR